MNTAIAQRPPGLVQLTPETLAELTEHPLRMLPAVLRPPTLTLWACHRHLAGLDSPLPLAALLAVWTAQDGLHHDDAQAICRAMVAPAALARHRFASDLTADLAQHVVDAISRRSAQAQAAARRETPGDVDVNEIRARLAAALPRV
jgi:hypothetical protein